MSIVYSRVCENCLKAYETCLRSSKPPICPDCDRKARNIKPTIIVEKVGARREKFANKYKDIICKLRNIK